MFRHVALWKFDDESTPGRNRENAIKIKAGLEELAYELHGIQQIDVSIDPARVPTCNADILLECVFENRDAYRAYLEHPRHLAVRRLIDSCTEEFLCMDFEAEEPELL